MMPDLGYIRRRSPGLDEPWKRWAKAVGRGIASHVIPLAFWFAVASVAWCHGAGTVAKQVDQARQAERLHSIAERAELAAIKEGWARGDSLCVLLPVKEGGGAVKLFCSDRPTVAAETMP